MKSLLVLWDTSLLLAAASLLALLVLLVARIAGSRRNQQRERFRRQVSRFLLTGENGPLRPSRLQSTVAAEVTIELAELVRGSDRVRFLANAERLGVPEVLRRQLRSSRAQDRLTAAEALAMFPGDTGREALAALDDPNRAVRLGAALALAHNHIAPPPDELIRKLELGSSERSLLVVSLMRDLVETDPQAVEQVLYDDTLPDEAKLAATDALAASGMVENAPLVAWMASAAKVQADLQPRIFRALGRIGHPGARDAILDGMRSSEWQVRSAAAEAAGKVGLTDAINPLTGLLEDEHWWTRFRAAEALTRLGSSGRRALIAAASEAVTPLARGAASATLAEHKLA